MHDDLGESRSEGIEGIYLGDDEMGRATGVSSDGGCTKNRCLHCLTY